MANRSQPWTPSSPTSPCSTRNRGHLVRGGPGEHQRRQGLQRGQGQDVAGIVAVDDKTVRFDLESGNAVFWVMAKFPLMPYHILSDVPPRRSASTPSWITPRPATAPSSSSNGDRPVHRVRVAGKIGGAMRLGPGWRGSPAGGRLGKLPDGSGPLRSRRTGCGAYPA